MLFEKVKSIWPVTENTLKHVRTSCLNLSSIQHPASSIQHPASSIQHPAPFRQDYDLGTDDVANALSTFFSQPRYLSESKVAIKQSNDVSGSNLNVGLLLGAGN